jgi:PD-(D/E)XK endonuclease
MDIRNHKKRGQWAELRFMTKAIELGFQVAKPLGDSAQYDVILDMGGRFVSVQIKSTYHGDSNATPGTYEASLLHACGPSGLYRASDFDYLAIYCIPKDVWYVIPFAVACEKHTIRVCPGDKLNQWEQYREAWYLLEDRAPCPRRKRGRVDLYGIIEDYVAPPRMRTPVPHRRAPGGRTTLEAAPAYGPCSPAPRPGLNSPRNHL